MKKQKIFRQVLSAALVILSAAIFTSGQGQSNVKHNTRPDQGSGSGGVAPAVRSSATVDPVKYTYEFTQPRFYIKHIFVEHDGNGRGKITFERMNEDVPVVDPIELSAAALTRITSYWSALQFLDSTANYQSDKQFAHLGTMRIGMEKGEKKRVAEFNWTHDSNASALVNEYRKVADQAIFVFDIGLARVNQPLNAPKLMESLESMLSRGGLSDPKQLLPLLKDLSTDEHVPLIARNHALRLIKKIEK